MGMFEDATESGGGALDNLAAGDEVRELAEVMTEVARQMETGDGGSGGSVDPVPPEYVVVPPDEERLACPAGTTTINFDRGRVDHDDVDGPLAEITPLKDLSGVFDGRLDAELRSLFAYSDVPTKLRIEGSGDAHVLDSCNYYPIHSQGFQKLTVSCPLPFELSLTAATRRQTFDTSGVAVHMDRFGYVDGSGGTLDTWTPLPMQPKHLYDEYGTTFGKPPVHTVSFSNTHLFIENTTSEDTGASGNDVDIRVLARNNHPGSGKFYEIKRWTNVSDGDHVDFTVDRKHHFLKVETRASTSGLVTATECQLAGGAP